jgi:hypothetical protein
MEMKWGVDSAHRQQRPNYERDYNGQRRSNFDIIHELSGMRPEFWGRYISGGNLQLQREEVEFLHQRNCRILPIYTGLLNSIRRGRFADGWSSADRAIRRAREFPIPIPFHVRIYADLEDYRFVTPAWIFGWWTRMTDSPYRGAGGLYGRVNVTMANAEYDQYSTGIVFPRPRARAVRAQYDPDAGGRQVVAQRWGPAASQAATMRYQGINSFDQRTIGLLMHGESGWTHYLSRFLWSNEPRTVSEDPPGRGREMVMPRSFAASRPIGGGVRTVIWQYRMNCYRIAGRTGLIDMDVALPEAFNEMW